MRSIKSNISHTYLGISQRNLYIDDTKNLVSISAHCLKIRQFSRLPLLQGERFKQVYVKILRRVTGQQVDRHSLRQKPRANF